MTPQVEVACNVCGSARHKVFVPAAQVRAQLRYLQKFHRRRMHPGAAYANALAERAEFTQNYATDIVLCDGCGLLFRDPRPAAREITDAYKHDHYGSERLQALFGSQLELFRSKASVLQDCLAQRQLSSPPLVVEVGSFVGGFLAAAREQGWNAIGIDPGEEVVAFCASQGLKVYRQTIDQCDLAPASADCVAIWNTLDQLPWSHSTLAAARRLLRPQGILAVRVPNGSAFQRATNRLRRPSALNHWLCAAMAWNNLLGFPYLYGYSIRTLDRLLAAHELERIKFVPDVLTRLADAQTKLWASLEERLLKGLWLAAIRADSRSEPAGSGLAPWFDAYYGPRQSAV